MLTVEDGTGLSNADSYVSLADLKSHWLKRGTDLTDTYEDEQLEAAIIAATDYIDTVGRYKGARATDTQVLEWPRIQCLDWSGVEVAGVPVRVKRACAELAFKALSQPLYQDAARGGRIISESVGSVSVTYDKDSPVGVVYQLAQNWLAPYLMQKNIRAVPGVADSALESMVGAASIGVHDNPGYGYLGDPTA